MNAMSSRVGGGMHDHNCGCEDGLPFSGGGKGWGLELNLWSSSYKWKDHFRWNKPGREDKLLMAGSNGWFHSSVHELLWWRLALQTNIAREKYSSAFLCHAYPTAQFTDLTVLHKLGRVPLPHDYHYSQHSYYCSTGGIFPPIFLCNRKKWI